MVILKGVKSEIDVKVIAEVLTDNGRVIKVPFVATFRRLSVTETEELLNSGPKYEGAEENFAALNSRFQSRAVRDNLLNLKNVPTETGEPYEFTEENVEAMLEVNEYRRALWEGLLSTVQGKAHTKN